MLVLPGKILSRRKGWWEQCEAIRALMHFAILRNRANLSEPFEKTLAFAKRTFIDRRYGGWYGTCEPSGDLDRENKGTEWKVDYHVVGMCREAVRLGEREGE